jgi:hypothetical protein
MEVIIDGIKYVPDVANVIKFYYMYDNHTFSRLNGKTIKEILQNADDIESSEAGSCGMLCSATVMKDDKEVKRVGCPAHSSGKYDPTKEKWNAGKEKWLKDLLEDKDVMRLISYE